MRYPLAGKWNAFTQGTPGNRFQDRYRKQHRSRSSQGVAGRLLRILLALVAAVVGVVLVFIPGPAFLFLFLAGALLASDWLWMARSMDWTEVRLRVLGRRVARWWNKLPSFGRAALIVAAGCLSVVTMYGAYRVMQ